MPTVGVGRGKGGSLLHLSQSCPGRTDGWILGRPSTSRVVLPSTHPPRLTRSFPRFHLPFQTGFAFLSKGKRARRSIRWDHVPGGPSWTYETNNHVFFDASSTATASLETRPAAFPCIPCKHTHLHQRTYATNHTDQPDAAAAAASVRGLGGGRARGEAPRQPTPTSRTCMRRLLHGCVNTCFPNDRPRHVAIIGSFVPGGEDPRREHARVGVALILAALFPHTCSCWCTSTVPRDVRALRIA